MVKTDILARENRVMINSIKTDIREIKDRVEKAFNHMSSRLPTWATILITILGASVTGLLVAVIK